MPAKRSPQFLAAVAALRELVAAEGETSAEYAYTEVMQERLKNIFIQKHGVKESGGRVCVHRLAGVRCPSPCDSSRIVPAHDHVTLWNKGGKPYMLVSQPYGLSYEQLKDTVAFCQQYGLTADVGADLAWHFPGNVLSIRYKRADAE